MMISQLFFFAFVISASSTTLSICGSPDNILHESTPVTRFQQYLRFKTAHPNPDYTAPVSYLTSIAHSLNLKTQTFEFVADKPVLVVTWTGYKPYLPSILLNSHLDSVPAEPTKWTHPPFSAVRDQHGRIFARGAQDDKCIAIQYLEAIRNLIRKGFVPARTVHVSYVPDEEIGGEDGAEKFVASKVFDELRVGFMLDEGQASVNDVFRVFYADRCPWKVIIKASGQPGHGSRLYDNGAMENLMKSIEGYVMNMQPSEAEAGYDIRMPPTADPDLMKKRIAQEWAPAVRNLTFEIQEKGPIRDLNGNPLMTAADDSNPWWAVFQQAIAAAGGKLAKPEILGSTTDARYMRQLGIPALGFSPMTNTPILLHDHNEFLKESVFLKGIEVYEHVISSLSLFEEINES
ncbi:Acy1 [Linum perenne]